MTVRSIRIFGDPVLTTPSQEIDIGDQTNRKLVKDLIDSVSVPGRAGVAAPQIGVNRRAFSYNVDGKISYVLNPKIVETSGELSEIGEGCLSLPGLWCQTPRFENAIVEGCDLDGQKILLEGSGLFAQILQHETDHLDGVLYIRRLSPPERKKAFREMMSRELF